MEDPAFGGWTGDPTLILFQKVAVSLLIGALVGLEREHSAQGGERRFAGIRTFPLIGLFGCLSALLADNFGAAVFFVSLGGMFALVVVAYTIGARAGHYGSTSEMAAILVFLLGGLVYLELYEIAIAISVGLAALLSVKTPLHSWVERVQKEDIYATLKFAIITAIILPVLPDETIGPLDVLNPRQVWYFVILIAGISFVGYVLSKVIGPRKGLTATGALGGLVSSTAVTFTFAQRSKEAPGLERTLTAGILLASTLMFPRVIVYVAVVHPLLLARLWHVLLFLTAAGVLASVAIGAGKRVQTGEPIELKNPFRLKTAMAFGLAFAVILILTRAADLYLGDEGVYLAAGIAGVTDVNAITLSMAQLSAEAISPDVAAVAIIIAVLTNTIVKAGIVFLLGNNQMRKYAAVGFSVLIAASVAIIGWLLAF